MKNKMRLFKVKPGKLGRWQDWCAEINGKLRQEAAETLVEEGLSREFSYSFRLGEEDYVLGFTEEHSSKPADMDREINKRHKQMIEECLEFVADGKNLYDIKA